MNPLPVCKNSFDDIALCLSGGGYRAAAYHLGTLKMLEELDLLKDVKYFSTASGGTITAMKFAVSKLKKETFDTFFVETMKFLQDVNVVDEAFQILETTPCPSGSKDLSLIRSAAEIYRLKLLGFKPITTPPEDWTIKDLKNEISSNNTFYDLIFNSTEFKSGNGFRFRASSNNKLVFGNKNTNVNDALTEQITLADIVAASSCFPAVFEPIRFPQDFVFVDRSQAVNPFKKAQAGLKSIALMDGGIFDNQGLHGMTVSYDEEPIPFGLIIVSDTTTLTTELLNYDIRPRHGGFSIKSVLAFSLIFFGLLLITSIAMFAKALSSLTPLSLLDFALFGFVGIVLLFASTVPFVSIFWGIQKLKSFEIMGDDFPI
jgi:predicted acylesterase/phospholipase RssA